MSRKPAPPEVVILHGAEPGSARPDEADTLVQAEFVAAGLAALGWHCRVQPVGLDLSAVAALAGGPPLVVFNLVESLAGQGGLLHLPAAVLEAVGVPFTGAGALALATTTDKPLAKQLLRASGLPTPDWWQGEPPPAASRVIVKPAREDASVGLDAQSVVAGSGAAAELEARRHRFGGEWFAERYVEGREFNVSLLADGDGVQVLAPAEICFDGFPADRPRILDYEAKWVVESAACQGSRRRPLDMTAEAGLAQTLAALSRRAWDVFALRGYARVDFRVDTAGQAWIIEVNANPCLAADAGFMAAAATAGLGPATVIERILRAATTVVPGAG